MLHGVLFDFHNTLVCADSVGEWLQAAAHEVQDTTLRPEDVLPVLRGIWSRASALYPDTAWDLDPRAHRRAFETVLTQESPCPPAVATALYDSMPGRWVAADGALTLLRDLKDQGVRTALVSNIALDVRPRLDELGMLPLLDKIVLSFEVGLVKPDPRIFARAAAALDVDPGDCVMVGDSAATDGGAASVGMCTVLVPVVEDRPDLSVAACLLTAGAGVSGGPPPTR